MTNITIKKIPDQIYEKLKKRANRHRRSLNSEIIHVLEEAVSPNRVDPDLVLSRARESRVRTRGQLSLKEIQEVIEEGRP